jgi:large repetitive protein
LASVWIALAAAACFPEYGFPSDPLDGGAQDGTTPPPPPEGDSGADGSSDATLDADGATDLRASCVLLLHMDEAAWPGTGKPIKDSSGSGNDGAAVGSATPTPAGKFGGAALLDGSGWINVPDALSLHVTRAVTYAAWIYPTALTTPPNGTSPGIISKRGGYTANVAYTLFLWENNQAWIDVAGTRFHSTFAFTNSAWYHIAVVYDGNAAVAAQRVRVYVNGALDTESNAPPELAANVEDVVIGSLPNGGTSFIGKIDEVAIWTRALSGAEIAALASATGAL